MPCRYMIAMHTEVQRKVEDELDALGLLATPANPHPRQLEYEDVSKLVYLNNCVKAGLHWLTKAGSSVIHSCPKNRHTSCTAADPSQDPA